MQNWIKLVLIAVGVTLGVLIINEVTYQGPKINKKKNVSPIGTEDFTPRTSVELPSFQDKNSKTDGPKKTLPPIFNSDNTFTSNNNGRTPTQHNQNYSSGTSSQPSRQKNRGGKSGGGGGGGGIGGGGGGIGIGTGNSKSNPTKPENPLNVVYWLELSNDPEYDKVRHNRTCNRFMNTKGEPCEKDKGEPCKTCGG